VSTHDEIEPAVTTATHGPFTFSARSMSYRAPPVTLTCCQLKATERSVACAVIHDGAGGRTVIVADPERTRLHVDASVTAVS
jgi:hypothetical protein